MRKKFFTNRQYRFERTQFEEADDEFIGQIVFVHFSILFPQGFETSKMPWLSFKSRMDGLMTNDCMTDLYLSHFDGPSTHSLTPKVLWAITTASL